MKVPKDHAYKPDNRIAVLREQKGLTQKELADSCDISIEHLAEIESGECRLEKESVVVGLLLARALGVSLEDLMLE